MTDQRDDRREGALLGLALGDALGTTLEFTRPPPLPWSTVAEGPHRDITGGGPFRLQPGQVTDDTHMAVCLARALREHGAALRAGELTTLAEAYADWVAVAFDAGNQTRAALQAFRAAAGARDRPVAGRVGQGDGASDGVRGARGGIPGARDTGSPGHGVGSPGMAALGAGLVAWRASGGRAAGNGSLMRTAPIGALVDEREARIRLAVDDSLVTHADPRCVLACAAYDEAIAAGVAGADERQMLEAARGALAPACAHAEARWRALGGGVAPWAEALSELSTDLDAAHLPDPGLDLTGPGAGYVRVAFRLAFWRLLHAAPESGSGARSTGPTGPGWRGAVIDAVNRGGDADTNGAIVGALLGARGGRGALPSGWVERVLACDPPAPWDRGGRYHPVAFLGASALPR